MDAKLLYWTAALANLGVIVACGARGVGAVRRGEVRTHRRMMLTSAALVGVFLVSYLLKVALLGKEDRSRWTGLDYAVLYAHELCIAAMLLAGAVALYRAWRFRKALGPRLALPSDPEALPGRSAHRAAGRVATRAGVLAFLTAFGVWLGMLLRA